MAFEKLKRHKSPGIDQIPAQLIKAEGRTIRSEIHKLIISIWNRRNCLRSGRSQSLYLFIRRVIKTEYSNYRSISLLSTTYTILSNILVSRLIPYAEETIRDHQCGF
jgi:hypothetical protein